MMKSEVDAYFDLGGHTRAITTASAEAQIWFDRGLNWCFGFNQEEGLTCFLKALQLDPSCAMAHWGVAYAAGPFYNMPWSDFSPDEATICTKFCFGHVKQAKQKSERCTEQEQGLINALSCRFQADHPVPQNDFDAWDDAYANAMRDVYAAHPLDLDVAALFAEAMMTRTPWKLWNIRTDEPAKGADTIEALDVIETAIAQASEMGLPQHPAILHLHIHATEMSNTPERALASADLLGTLCPDAGHMNHMPGHTYVLCGMYEQAKVASEIAIRADRMYLEYAGPYNFYTTARCHDLHLMMYTCMLLGQCEPAIAAADEMCATLSPDVLNVEGKPYLSMTMEGYYSMMMHVLVRFGRWQQIIEKPLPSDPELYCVSTSMHHYAKGVAYAALSRFGEAEVERERFSNSVASIPSDRRFFNNPAVQIMGIAEKMLDGELAYHKGNHDRAFDDLREAVVRDDCLAYSEPWAWMHPPRHALGALLIEQGHFEEAEDVYRSDLGLNDYLQRCAQHPNNVWSLVGLAECLRHRGAAEELTQIARKVQAALDLTDVGISSSCCCRMRSDFPPN